MAAVLACGRGAVLSHRSAGALWRLTSAEGDGVVHVSVMSSGTRRRRGIQVHRTSTLRRRDVTRVQGIPVTNVPRTLLDLATMLESATWERAFVEAQVRRLVHAQDMLDVLERHPRHAGAPLMRSVLATDPALTRSEAERRLLKMLRAARLPNAVVNSRVAGYEVDFLWPAERLIVEVDGYAFHSTRTAFERDRLRDADLQARGYRVIRVTWRQLVDESEAVLARLAQALRMASTA